MLISAEFATANIADEREDRVEGQARRARRHHLGQRRPLGLVAQVPYRHQGHGRDRDQDVDHPGDAEPGQHHLGEVAARVLALLGHVDRVLEADHREERQRGRRGDGEEHALVLGGVERRTTSVKSALPRVMAYSPTKITSSRPDSSTRVSTTLALTLSPTPRKFTAATSA